MKSEEKFRKFTMGMKELMDKYNIDIERIENIKIHNKECPSDELWMAGYRFNNRP
ncbi:MAG: hypothetical protein ACOCUI_00910 [bacterium]